MRKTIRTALAATAVVGLLSMPAAGAGAAAGSTVTELTLNGVVGTVSITVPSGDLTTPKDLGSMNIAAGSNATQNSLGQVVASDTTTGLLRTATLTARSTLGVAGATGFCQDTDDDITGGITCSSDPTELIIATNVNYDWNTVVNSGNATGATVETDGPLTTATAVFTGTGVGSYTLTWTPILSVTLLGTEAAGTYYGSIEHSVTAASM